MADSDKNILITPNTGQSSEPKIEFVGSSSLPITLKVLDDNSLSWEGGEGQLFSITNNLSSGTIFSVNDISGIPSIEVDADGTVVLAEFSGNVGIGTTSPSHKLTVNGDISGSTIIGSTITGSLISGSTAQFTSITGSFSGSGSGITNLNYSNITNPPTIGNATVTISAGNGLTTGGSLTTNQATNSTITLNVGAGTGISVAADSVAIDTSVVPRLSVNNTFTGTNTFGVITASSIDVDTITAREYYTELVSASVIYQSGSTKFGDTSDDIHQFTGSLYISGSSVTLTGGSFSGNGSGLTSLNASNISAGTLNSARLPDLVVADFSAAAIQLSSETFSDSDTVLMTAAAVEDRILSKGYTTNVGDITGVTAGTGLSGGGTSGAVTLALDFSELTDMTADIAGTTEFILQNGTTESRKAASEIKLSVFNNDSGWTTNAGTVTSIATGNGITGGTITSTGTLGLTGQALALHNLSTNGLITRTGTGTVAGRTIAGGTGITVTNGDGVSGNPSIALTNNSLTIGSTSVSLGGTATTIAGLTSVTSTGFTGSLSGNASTATTATTATNATNVAVTNDTATNSTHYVAFVGGTSGNQAVNVDSSTLTYNPSSNTLTVSNLAGNASSATRAANIDVSIDSSTNTLRYLTFVDSVGNGVPISILSSSLIYNPSTDTLTVANLSGNASTATTATNATNVTVTNDTATNSTHYVAFVGGTSGNQAINVDSSTLTYNPSSNTLTTGRYIGGLFVSSNGTAGSPAFTAGDDLNTGIYFPAADTIGFVEGGVERMRINDSGNVGIGTINPSQQLEVLGVSPFIRISNAAETEAGIEFVDRDVPASQYAKITYDSGINNELKFYVDSTTPAMIIDDSGNIGIGTTNPLSTAILHISGIDKSLYIDRNARTVGIDGGGIVLSSGSTPELLLNNDDNGAYFVGFEKPAKIMHTNSSFSAINSGLIVASDETTIGYGSQTAITVDDKTTKIQAVDTSLPALTVTGNVDLSDNLAIGLSSPATPLTRLHIRDGTVPTYFRDTIASVLIERDDAHIQLASNDSGGFGSALVLTNGSKNWFIQNRPSDDALNFRYYSTPGNGDFIDSSSSEMTLSNTGDLTTGGSFRSNSGTAGSPAFASSNDTHTGIFFPAGDTIAFAEGGVERMRINSSGYVGIGTNSPDTKLHIKCGDHAYNGIRLEEFDTATYWDIYYGSSGQAGIIDDNLYFSKASNYLLGGYLDDAVNVANIDFTGQHRSLPSSGSIESYIDKIGLIVVSDGQYANFNGHNGININEALPKVTLSNQRNQKSCFGVISDKEDENSEGRVYHQGRWASLFEKNIEDNRLIINSLGEGGIWVCNVNGNLENGDYITTCEVPGYGMKQDDDLLHNYTVAKITCNCDFDLQSPIYICEEFQWEGQTYRRAFVGCTYHCG